jgi:antitoxin component YwqK of YwqJK toxin-antitoxin module
LKVEGSFKHGKQDGIWKAWTENGQLASEEGFKDDWSTYRRGEDIGCYMGWKDCKDDPSRNLTRSMSEKMADELDEPESVPEVKLEEKRRVPEIKLEEKRREKKPRKKAGGGGKPHGRASR